MNTVIILSGIIYFLVYYLYIDKTVWSIENDSYFKWIFYFVVMVCGIEAGYHYNSYSNRRKDIFIFIGITTAYFAIKALLSKNILMEYQFLLHILTLPWIFYLLRTSKASFMQRFISSSPANGLIEFIASITLEIYLFQRFLYKQELINNLGFPFNLLFFTIILVLISWGLHTLYNLQLSKNKK